MPAIFSELSEKNEDIVVLVAKSIRVAQETTKQPRSFPKNARNKRCTLHNPQIRLPCNHQWIHRQQAIAAKASTPL